VIEIEQASIYIINVRVNVTVVDLFIEAGVAASQVFGTEIGLFAEVDLFAMFGLFAIYVAHLF
jgi:hypothetical protein